MAGPAITRFSEAQQLVYWRDRNFTVIVWWLQGKACSPVPCLLLGLSLAIRLRAQSRGTFARMLRGTAARGQKAAWVSATGPRERRAALAVLPCWKARGAKHKESKCWCECHSSPAVES